MYVSFQTKRTRLLLFNTVTFCSIWLCVQFYSLLHRPLFTKFNTHPSWAKLVANHKTYHIPSYYHQREKRSADFGFWPCDPPYFNTVFSTLKVRESEWPGGLNLTNSSKANQPMWSSSWPNQPLRSNQLINCWGHITLMKTRKDIFVFPETFVKGITFQFLCVQN